MKKYDIVYILRNDISSEEIRYSLRSVEKNFPHNKVWFYGGKPKGIEPDEYVKVIQQGDSRYDKVTNTIKEICRNDEISGSFWLFNDDFFVMKEVTDFKPMVSGTIEERVQYIIRRHGCKSTYAKRLERTGEKLRAKGYDTMCYAMHAPMLINRKTALKALQEFAGEAMFRCIYGNYVGEEPEITKDVKVFGDEIPPEDSVFLSTDDAAFRSRGGTLVRGRFTTPSRWEVGHA